MKMASFARRLTDAALLLATAGCVFSAYAIGRYDQWKATPRQESTHYWNVPGAVDYIPSVNGMRLDCSKENKQKLREALHACYKREKATL